MLSHLVRSFPFLVILSAGVVYAEDSCVKLSRLDCRKSSECSLDCNTDPKRPYACTSPYFCRAKEAQCEKGFKQTDFSKGREGEAKCNARPGCFFDNRGCYCDCEEDVGSGCVCACGGGPPSDCHRK